LARVVLLALIAAILAFVDSQYFSTFTSPTGFRPSLIRAALLLGVVLCLAALYAEGATPDKPGGRSRWRAGVLTAVLCVVRWAYAVNSCICWTHSFPSRRGSAGR
jgi:hypothetical protein